MKTKMKVELKMENTTHTFREMNVVLQLVYKLQIKHKTVISWSLRKKKECIFVMFSLSERIFLTFVFYPDVAFSF